jgi:DnaJ-class molecular chaperone
MYDYYRILGLKPNATAPEIKDAYRNLARLHHPDRHQGRADAEEKFKEISMAYQVLYDPERRKAYDHDRQFNPPSFDPRAAAEEMGFSNVFSAIFGKR